jgi:hypothetical protein
MANPVGRPSKYNAEMQERADYYVLHWAEEPIKDVVPSRVGLCCWLGISKQTSFEWEKIHPEFSDTLENVNTLQEKVSINGGMSGVFNSTITKLVLANHGYSDKSELDHRSGDGSMTPTFSSMYGKPQQ